MEGIQRGADRDHHDKRKENYRIDRLRKSSGTSAAQHWPGKHHRQYHRDDAVNHITQQYTHIPWPATAHVPCLVNLLLTRPHLGLIQILIIGAKDQPVQLKVKLEKQFWPIVEFNEPGQHLLNERRQQIEPQRPAHPQRQRLHAPRSRKLIQNAGCEIDVDERDTRPQQRTPYPGRQMAWFQPMD